MGIDSFLVRGISRLYLRDNVDTVIVMGYPTTVQLIQRRRSQQWYVNFPAAVANACDFVKGETVEWTIVDRRQMVLTRQVVARAPSLVKAKSKRTG
jgi:hypothetical protein